MSGSRVSAASALLLGAVFAGVAFGAAGGTELGRTTVVELILLVAGGLLAAGALLWGKRGPLHGGAALVLLAALAALTGLSILWSIAPELSLVDAARMLAYVAVFGAAIGAARLWPRSSPVLLHGLLLGAGAVIAYALASRVWPGSLAEQELGNRVGEPYGYWNAVGTTAAIMVPAALWLGSRRGGAVGGRVAAYPAMGLALLGILLSQSRGALAAAALGAIAWFALVPLRLRSLPVLLLPAVAVAPLTAWALSQDAFSDFGLPLSAKESVAGEFGLFLLATLAALLALGLVVNAGLARMLPPVALRRRLGLAAVAAACAVPLVLFTSVAFSDRGLSGTISDRVDELTDERSAAPSGGAERFSSASSTRAAVWREAGKVFADRRAAGTGAGTFRLSRLRYRKSEQVAGHAHGFVPQTIADLGLVGLGLAIALLVAWLVAGARATALYPRLLGRGPPARRDWTPERMTMLALTLVAVVFGLQSAIDWTWFVPGPSVMALAAAGFVAGRGPFVSAWEPSPESEAAAAPATARRMRVLGVELSVPGRARIAGATAAIVAALLAAWTAWQPEAADRAANRAAELVEQREFERALAEAADAEDLNPLASKPLLAAAAAHSAAGDRDAARRTLERAVLRFPGDPSTWLQLANFQLFELDRPRAAGETLRAVLYLDPKSKAGRRLFLEARARIRAKQRAAELRRARAEARRRAKRLREALAAGAAAQGAPTGTTAQGAPTGTTTQGAPTGTTTPSTGGAQATP